MINEERVKKPSRDTSILPFVFDSGLTMDLTARCNSSDPFFVRREILSAGLVPANRKISHSYVTYPYV